MLILTVDKMRMTATAIHKFSGTTVVVNLSRCTLCGHEITGDVYWNSERPYCSKCNNNYFTQNELIEV